MFERGSSGGSFLGHCKTNADSMSFSFDLPNASFVLYCGSLVGYCVVDGWCHSGVADSLPSFPQAVRSREWAS